MISREWWPLETSIVAFRDRLHGLGLTAKRKKNGLKLQEIRDLAQSLRALLSLWRASEASGLRAFSDWFACKTLLNELEASMGVLQGLLAGDEDLRTFEELRAWLPSRLEELAPVCRQSVVDLDEGLTEEARWLRSVLGPR